jgi:hypothetical protein
MSNNVQYFQGYTLVDITATGVVRGNDELPRNQQRNWETVIQCLSLQTQPNIIHLPVVTELDVAGTGFGDFYQGHQRVWHWSWSIEHEGIYDHGNKKLATLLRDFEQVPIVTGLEETARFMLPIFYPHGTIKNIYFKEVFPN